MNKPLAYRMRPTTLDEIAGQQDILKKGSILRTLVEEDALQSILLYGPPGTGKTTIAEVIANQTNAEFRPINAVASGKKDLETACKKAEAALTNGTRTILFIDEIHRFNKAQQDYLLPFVENGTVILIGATTENPFFEVNPALVSRSVLLQLQPVEAADIEPVLLRALNDEDRGLGKDRLTISKEALRLLAVQAGGDVRHALQLLELSAILTKKSHTEITIDDVKQTIQTPSMAYDKNGNQHYDTISAFIKSIRGSDPDAALYYLARMLVSGEDPKFIARRLMISASEDIGNADPNAITVATSTSLVTERVGLPECRLALAQAAIYLAMAPKSNSAIVGINRAIAYVKAHPNEPIPVHLRDAHYKSAGKLGSGVGYQYPHDFPDHWVVQQYLPDAVQEYFYENTHQGYEAVQADYRNQIANARRASTK